MDFSDNQLSKIPDSIDKLEQLTSIKLSGNKDYVEELGSSELGMVDVLRILRMKKNEPEDESKYIKDLLVTRKNNYVLCRKR